MTSAMELQLGELLREVLGLPEHFLLAPSTPLLGALSALDSVAVVTLLGECETRFGFTVHDEELSAAVFATFGTLLDWVAARAGATAAK